MTETSSENSLPEDSLTVAVTSEPGQALAEEPAENPALKPVVRAIQRLEDVIDTETRLLLEGGNPDLAEINARKSRGLYDFNKAIKKAAGAAEPATMKPLQPLLDRLKHKLEKNCEALQLHLRAVGELADLIRGALETQEADGTYSMQSARLGHAR
ncbi:flagellar protein FlgN [Brucella intermedia]|uniref:Flagellar protein FlgN n=1 Tax=Brucella intermedia TaxID=94625 RepID=A0A6N6R5X2_9HYPH|nr:flagellar protein FlgN [Brucella intermedia]PJR87332.1 flagellar protein FlgN [Ochrobactrum sp. 721/2009]PJT13519.1 flagellar protein FlgN [Ochrobactrum sp. 720/2009]PJT23064.1 flagellar protein FlgN [Ochrobactrum sp. 715/2009]PJT28888.1 flagellar protein FlgN [Ochrobactrum sp. 695/2009]PJT32392.1 flagellar protein FlgN [Ochrobactrum sp. 689/2009]